MSDYDSGAERGTERLNRTQRSPRAQGRPAGFDVDQARVRIGAAQRKAHRANVHPGPPLPLELLLARLPEPIIRDLSVDDICRETLVIVDLLGMDNIDLCP
jgi:hypothetical protein